LGGFDPHTYSRNVNSGSNGWLGLIVGPLEYLENTIKTIKDITNKANKDPNNFKVIPLTYPKIVDSKSQPTWLLMSCIYQYSYSFTSHSSLEKRMDRGDDANDSKNDQFSVID